MASAAFESGKKIRIPVASDGDLVTARREGRVMAEQMGFTASEATLVATAISEPRNGEIQLGLINDSSRRGITIVASDQGPGIADIKLATQPGYSTSGGLGLGLPGVRRIMDEFSISSELGRGTTITVIKWKRR